MKNKINTFFIVAFVLTLSACAAKQTIPGAERVELVNDLPDWEKCEFVGEVVGSQGNWFTGDVTSNKNLVIGARNELRNEAYKLGANVVYVQDLKTRMHMVLWAQQIQLVLVKHINVSDLSPKLEP